MTQQWHCEILQWLAVVQAVGHGPQNVPVQLAGSVCKLRSHSAASAALLQALEWNNEILTAQSRLEKAVSVASSFTERRTWK